MPSQITHYLGLAAHGEVSGSATAKQLPSVKGKWVKFKAAIDNPSNVYVAPNSAVTKAAGTTTTTAGWGLDAGQETDWLPIPGGDLDSFYLIGDVAGDDLLYMVLR